MVRREIALAAALAAILAIPALGYLANERQLHFRARAVVAQATGLIELRPSGGGWQPAGRGTRLTLGDELRTGEGTAVIDATGRFRVELEPGAHLALASAGALSLQGGSALVEVPLGSVITVAAPSGATAEVSGVGARFRARSEGGLLVEALSGQVRLRGVRKAVDVRAGQRSEVPAGGEPEDPAPGDGR